MKATSNSIKFFTIIELMIVIGLMSVIGGFFAVRTFGYLQEQTFATEKKVIESRFQLANRISTLCDTRITPTVGGTSLTFHTTDRVPPSLAAVVKRPIKLHNHPIKPPSSANHKPQYPNEATLSPS